MTKKEEVFEFVTKNPVFSLATIDGSRPRVRMMMLYKASMIKSTSNFELNRPLSIYERQRKNNSWFVCYG